MAIILMAIKINKKNGVRPRPKCREKAKKFKLSPRHTINDEKKN